MFLKYWLYIQNIVVAETCARFKPLSNNNYMQEKGREDRSFTILVLHWPLLFRTGSTPSEPEIREVVRRNVSFESQYLIQVMNWFLGDVNLMIGCYE